jgi:non-ribosomal peptide synthetase component F
VPDRDALVSVHQGIRLTYAQFLAAVEQIARGLPALGVEPGERVGHRIQRRRVRVVLGPKPFKHRRSGRRIWRTDVVEQDAHRPPDKLSSHCTTLRCRTHKVSALAADTTPQQTAFLQLTRSAYLRPHTERPPIEKPRLEGRDNL